MARLLAAQVLLVAVSPTVGLRSGLKVVNCARHHVRATCVACAQEDRAALERMFRSSTNQDAPNTAPPPGCMLDVPLWRVQWTVLPGHISVLHVHVPHYCHMFEQMIGDAAADEEIVTFGADGPQYGHLLLPGGSAALDKPESLLTRGTTAPTIGSLMRIREVRRLDSGRLAIVSEALVRFRVLRGTQALPYSRADIEMLPDAEETTAWLGPVEAMYASPRLRIAAARSAAAASAAVWAAHEASEVEVGLDRKSVV